MENLPHRPRPRTHRPSHDLRIRLCEEDVACLLTLHDCGWSARKLAGHFGISKSQVHRIVQGASRLQPSKLTDQVVRQALRLRRAGCSVAGIARELGLHRSTVEKLTHGHDQKA